MRFEGIDFDLAERSPAPRRALDFGCGGGAVSLYLLRNGVAVVGCDRDDACGDAIATAAGPALRENFEFINVMRESNAFAARHDQFDLIVCREVLEHVPDYRRLLSDFHTVAAPGGQLIISCPSAHTEAVFSFFDPEWMEKCEHVHVHRRRTLIQDLQGAGFTIEKVEGQGFRWSLMWLLLGPFRINHVMGNPTSHPRLSRFAIRASGRVEKFKLLNWIGNKLFPKSYVYYARKTKPTLLVVYDFREWILGRWAENIKALYSDEYDVECVSMFDLEKDRVRGRKLVQGADLIHLMLPHPFETVESFGPSAPIIATIHHWVDWTTVAPAAERANEIVTGAQEWKPRLAEMGVAEDRITVVRSGVEKSFFDEAPALFPRKPGKITFGFFGKFDSNEADRKGTRHLLALVEEIAGAGLGDQFHLVLSGRGWAAFAAQVRSKGIEVEWAEFVPSEQVPSLYRSVDVYMMLSDVEGGPATIVESMASGTLVFATNVGVVKDIVRDGETGVIIDSGLPGVIIDQMLHFRDSPSEADRIRLAARAFARDHMGYDKTLAPLGPLYKRVLAEAAVLSKTATRASA